MPTTRVTFSALLAIVLAMAASPARADAIDGDWCFGAQNLNIRGPSIRTPSGTQMSGNYDRHGFSYVVPSNEPEAGSEVVMRLHGEELMSLVRKSGATTSAPESWRRCKPVS